MIRPRDRIGWRGRATDARFRGGWSVSQAPPARPRTVAAVTDRLHLADGTAEVLDSLRRSLAGSGATAPLPADRAEREQTLAMLRPEIAVEEADAAAVVATSGSTGRPRGVVLSRSALIASAEATHRRLGGPGRWVLALPAHYVAGLMVLVRSLVADRPVVELDGRLDALPTVELTDRRPALPVAGPHPADAGSRRSGPYRGPAAASTPCCWAGRRPTRPCWRSGGGRHPRRDHVRDERDLWRLRVRRCVPSTASTSPRTRTGGSASAVRRCSPATGSIPRPRPTPWWATGCSPVTAVRSAPTVGSPCWGGSTTSSSPAV